MAERPCRILRLSSPQGHTSERVYHAVQRDAISALCGRRPHGNSNWFPIEGQAVTCLACLREIQRRR
jgi:hypothetical protein